LLHLKSLNITPPGEFRFRDPDSGFEMKEGTFYELTRTVAIHRRNNNFRPLAEAEIEDAVCQSLSPGAQAEYCAEGARIPTFVPWTDVLNFLKTAGAWLAGGLSTVEPIEAERRAGICAGCPYNRGLSGGCAACSNAVNSLRSEVLHKSTSLDGKLEACAICHCDNKMTVHVPLQTLETVPHDFGIASWCWRNPASSNYTSGK
jgi:hypothetical protein